MSETGRQPEIAQPSRLLSQLADAGETGTLYVDGGSSGTVHLIDGRVSCVESPAAPGVGALLTTSGRLAEHTWQAAVQTGAAGHRVGRLLVEQGHLMQSELELCVLGAIYDAAFFVLTTAATSVRFAPGELHWLGRVVEVEVGALERETSRRGRRLDEIFPESSVDHAPVTPVPTPPVQRVVLTAAQWELVVHADGRRTAADLSRLLGRPGYATLQEVRRLSAAGLLRNAGPPSSGGDRGAVDAPPDEGASAVADPDHGVTGPDPVAEGESPTRTRAATRREGGHRRQRDPQPSGPNGAGPVDAVPDDALLGRLRAALKALR
ncbi:DUF4388 domain-containing protein [Planosporangium mesophilum]|uniref:PatA-like N-terminal domain-containing protein n=1 Tax=Planosporangium mesophilum TaxID=689768 RepID=A0A8J3TED2_9ACTN|nr:DUF4388 domain-containing protein [Planosporangium mesophilum]NJC81953.1 ADAM 12 protein [Planosporangium mesophilum]GII25283.1 hypothetical protein Pme01_48800 [Planosporangium mesophilum]